MAYRITGKEKEWAIRAIVLGVAFYFISAPIKDWVNVTFNGNRIFVGLGILLVMLYFWDVH